MRLTFWDYVNLFCAAGIVVAFTALGLNLAEQAGRAAHTQAPVPSNPTCPADAWETFERLDMRLPVPERHTWRLVCLSVEVEPLTGELPIGQFTLESRVHYGVWYRFAWEVLTDA